MFCLGTNIGIRRMVHSGDHKVTEAQLRRTRTLFVNRDTLRKAVATVVNQTLRQRDERWWGTGTACASDSKKFGSWQSNMMTEWHQRYGGPGVMIYWHVERKSVCVYSQLTACSASEPAAMMEGLIRHSTDIEASEIRSNVADYLADEQLRQEVHEGLQVVEQWNSANVAIYYGKEGELTSPDRETQEISMLALHLLQSALVLVNTRLIDRILSEPAWAAKMTERDLRGLTPMFWGNVLLHGVFAIDLNKRLDYDRVPADDDVDKEFHDATVGTAH